MAFRDFPDQGQGIELLQRSLERQRLGHAYLFTGQDLTDLEGIASALAKTLSCRQPATRSGASIDCCEQCLSCQKISHDNHPDVPLGPSGVQNPRDHDRSIAGSDAGNLSQAQRSPV